ncbi:hypothetical protein DDL46_15105, partial [Staphylococcus aureus]
TVLLRLGGTVAGSTVSQQRVVLVQLGDVTGRVVVGVRSREGVLLGGRLLRTAVLRAEEPGVLVGALGTVIGGAVLRRPGRVARPGVGGAGGLVAHGINHEPATCGMDERRLSRRSEFPTSGRWGRHH